jgi:predicted RNase H-like nuclease (RuvC/YqgF family)
MMSERSPEEVQGESAAISQLRARLQEVQSELDELQERRGKLDRALEEKRRERDALSLSIRSLGGKSEDGQEPDGPRIEVRYRGGDRPTIRIIARERAEESGGTLKIRDLLRETRRLGFKSDQGGLHTYLKGLEEFIQSGPGEFTLRIDAQDPDEAEYEPAQKTEEAP